MRLIDADAFKNYIQNGLEDVRYFFKDNGKRAEKVIEGICEDIDEQPTIELPKWIPCSERLPSEKGEYLVTYHPCYHDNVEPKVKVGIDTFRGKTSWAKRKYQKVVAWMPLPEPYKRGKADD